VSDKNEGDIEIVLKDDAAPEKEQDIVLADDKASEGKPELSPEDGIRELKVSLERERQARVEAERRAQQQAAQAHLMTREVEDNQRQMLSSALEMVNSERVMLRSQYAEAMSQGNYAMVAEINDRMNDLAVKANVIEQGRDAMEGQQKQQKQPVQQQQPYAGDPVEVFAAQLTPRSASWVREHPEFVRDQKLNRKMLAAHELAVADGISPDSDEYFDHVEGTLGVNRSAEQGDAPKHQRRAAPAIAPVTRASMNGDGSRPNVVRLSAEQREMASMMNMTPEEYARTMRDLKREGRMN
jgi:nitrate reductase alpha subunit